jgi:hypothetical protein
MADNQQDEKRIDDSDVQQDSPAEAEAEVPDPDGQDDTSDEPEVGVVGLGVIGATGANLGRR